MPEPWPEAKAAPWYNIVGADPVLTDPAHGDYRPIPGSQAAAYGCQTFPSAPVAVRREPTAMAIAPARGGGRLEVGGEITVDTVWDAADVQVIDDVTVGAGVVLAVAPGVRVAFAGHHALRVQGRLLAIGTADEPIHFTSADPTGFAIDPSLTGAWDGIRFESTPATSGGSRLEHCVVEYAKAARDTGLVGALVCDGVSQVEVVDCVLRHNVADHGGALFCARGAAPRLVGCLLTDNHALVGGAAVYAVDGYPRLVACTIADNADHNAEPFDEAMAVLSYFSKPVTTGSILWGNTSHYFEGGQLWQAKPFYTTWSDIEGGFKGTGNIAAWPDFAGAGEHPYTPRPQSSCRDRGPIEVTGLGLPDLDLAGRPRVDGGRVDMGAYETGVATMVEPGAAAGGGPLALTVSPNPANPRTVIGFTLARAAFARLEVFDLRGRRVGLLLAGELAAGPHAIRWDGRDGAGEPVAAGSYVCRLTAGGRAATGVVSLLR